MCVNLSSAVMHCRFSTHIPAVLTLSDFSLLRSPLISSSFREICESITHTNRHTLKSRGWQSRSMILFLSFPSRSRVSRYALCILSSSLPTVFKCRHSGSLSHQAHTGAHTFPPFMVMTWLATAATSVPGTAGVCQLHWAEKMLFQYTAQQMHWLLWCWQAVSSISSVTTL